MEDKEKRLRKILVKICMKGKLKLVGSLEEAHLVLVGDRQCVSRTKLIGKDTYLLIIEKGYTFPEEDVYYLVSTNPRDMKHIEQKFLTNAFAMVKPAPK